MNRALISAEGDSCVSQLSLFHPDLEAIDFPALFDLSRFGLMTDDQLIRRYADPVLGAARVALLDELGIIALWCFQPLARARVFEPTRLVHQVAAIHGLRPRKPRRDHAAHDVALVDLADILIAQDPTRRFYAENEVRGVLDQVAPPRRPMRGDKRHRPDGLLLEGTHRIGIELERSEKYGNRYADISGWFVQELRVDLVRWYIESPRILERLRAVNEMHGFDRDMRIELEPFPAGLHIRELVGRFEPRPSVTARASRRRK